jgi:hypothetical protein
MNKWIKVEDKLPEHGMLVITWNGNSYRVCRYETALTWKGYKMKFVSVMNRFWDDDATHWMRFPKPPIQ